MNFISTCLEVRAQCRRLPQRDFSSFWVGFNAARATMRIDCAAAWIEASAAWSLEERKRTCSTSRSFISLIILNVLFSCV